MSAGIAIPGGRPPRRRPVWYPWLALVWLAAALSPAAQGQTDDYRLGREDTFQVYVLGEEDLSVEVTVTDEGTVFYPLLGEIEVEGLTPDQAEELITRLLKGPYLVDPVVSVTMVKYRRFFIEGQVRNPGAYPYTPGLTVRQAITNAGGFTDLASHSRIYVIHEDAPVDDRRKVTLNTPVSPGDTVTIEESFF